MARHADRSRRQLAEHKEQGSSTKAQDAGTLCRCQGYRVLATGSWYNICNSPGSSPAPAPPVRCPCPMLPICCSGPRLALCCCANDRNNQAGLKHATPFPQSLVCGCTQAVDNEQQGSSRTARCGHISPLARHAHPNCRQVVQREQQGSNTIGRCGHVQPLTRHADPSGSHWRRGH